MAGRGGEPHGWAGSTPGNAGATPGMTAGSPPGGVAGVPVGGAAGAGGACPTIDCSEDCPFGFWDDADGCATCDCAPPPVVMQTGGVTHDPAHVTFDAFCEYSPGSGVFNYQFRWTYDDPTVEDEEEFVIVALETHDPPDRVAFPGGAWSTSFPTSDSVSLTVVDGFLSTRSLPGPERGGVYFVMESDGDYPGTVVVGAPISQPSGCW
jgi:hypothetical protein